MLKFLQQTYREMQPQGNFAHLARTVDQYLAPETPVWWVDYQDSNLASESLSLGLARSPCPIGCLWLGNAIDQLRGDRHAHIFLLYVDPQHRRRGIGTALMHRAEAWARERGDRQIGLQVFASNQAALSLYSNLGFQVQSLWMVKLLEE